MTHNETRVPNERLIAEATEMCRYPNVHFHYSDGPRVMMALVQALRANAEAEPAFISRAFDPMTAHLFHPLSSPSPSDGEVSDRVLELARDAYEDFSGEIASKQALRLAINCALQSSKGGQP